MRIQSENSNVSLWNQKESKTVDKNIKVSDKIEQLKQNPVQVDISKEGMEQYRNTIQQSDPVDEELHIIHPQMSYEMELSSKMNQINSSKTNNTVEDRANSMVEAYASLYAEIVQGYENGTRVRYAQSGEDRVLTKEEDLAELDATYKNQTESFEYLFHLEQESQSRLESSIRNTA